MSPHRDTLARGSKIGLGRHRILVVAQVIAGVSQQLDERDAQVGRVGLGPLRHDQRQAVEDQFAKALVILRQVIDIRLRALRRRAGARRLAIQIGGAARLETEADLVVPRIELIHRFARGLSVRGFYQADGVVRKVSRFVNAHFKIIVERRIGLPLDANRLDLHIANAAAAGEHDIGLLDVLRGFSQKENIQRKLLLIDHFDIVQAKQASCPYIFAPSLFPAAQVWVIHKKAPSDRTYTLGALRTKFSVRASPVRLTTYFTTTLSVESCAVTSSDCRSITSPR